MSTSEPYPLYRALRGTLTSEVNFTGRGYPCQKHSRGRLGVIVKFTFLGDPCQKYLRGRFDNLVKFTFGTDPRQKALWGMLPSKVERLCVHLRALPPLQCPQRHIAFRGEFHRLEQPLPEVPLGPIV